MKKQRTLKHSVKAVGVGVHTGKQVHLTLNPAQPNTGITFRRIDLDPCVAITAHPHAVGDTRLATTLVKDNVRISTVEHLMSAFAGLGIDNAIVDVDAEELPIMDGSAVIFVFLIESAGIVEQDAPKRFIRIKKPIMVQSGDAYARFEPYLGSKFSLQVDFAHPVIQASNQSISIHISKMSYIKEVSRARTFGFLQDLEALRANNLGLGGSLDNALVFDHEKLMNENGFRYKDEVVRHKLLDAIGDIYVLGCSIVGAYSGYKPGHAVNNQLTRALLLDSTAWEYTHGEGL